VIAAEAGDEDACRRLVAAFFPAIVGVALGFPSSTGVEQQDLLQEGVAGLLVAAHRYDPKLKTPFWAYASFWVRKSMQELVSELTRPVALSDRAVRELARIRTAQSDHLRAHGSFPTSKELSSATGLTRTQLEHLQATERTPRVMDELLGDTIADPTAEQAYDEVLDELEVREVQERTERLDERERVVIRAHFGLGEHAQTLDQIGAGLGLTAERARQIEAGALTKLRAQE